MTGIPRSILLAFALLVAAGCGGTETVIIEKTFDPATAPVPGVYALKLFNGKPLPYTLNSTDMVFADTLFIGNDGKWRGSGAFERRRADGTVTRGRLENLGGTWARFGVTVVLSSDRTTQYQGTFDGYSLMLRDAVPDAFVWSK